MGQTAEVDASPPWPLPGGASIAVSLFPAGALPAELLVIEYWLTAAWNISHTDVAQNPKCVTSALIEM